MTPTPADIRNAVLLSVATAAAGFFVPALPYVGIPLAGFALGWIAYRFGTGPSVALALASSALVAVFGPAAVGADPLDALFVAVALLAAGPAAAWGLRRYSAYSVVAVATLAAAGAYLVAPVGANTLDLLVTTWRTIPTVAAASGPVADPAALKQNVALLIAQVTVTWPAWAVYMTGAGMLMAVPLVSRAGRAAGVEVKRYPQLADTDMTFHLVWPTIAGLALLAVGTFWGHGQGAVHSAGLNLLLIVRPALVVQGLGVFAALYRKIGVGRVMRTIGFVLLGFTEMLVPSVSVLGLVDLFLNFRKVAREQGTVSTRAAL